MPQNNANAGDANAPANAPTPPPAAEPTPTPANAPPANAPVVNVPAPVVNVSVPAAPVTVDEYYVLSYSREVKNPRGSQARVVPGGNADGSDKIERFDVQQGTGLHVRACEARVSDDGRTATPTSGKPPMKYGPGVPGCWGWPGDKDE